ncbi:MAG: TIGR04438 family Trp-rich protein [Burkholderiaceae bacterium]
MIVLCIAVVLLVLKLLEVGPLATLSWWWVMLPFGLAFLWFEVFEALMGRDKRTVEHEHYDKLRKARVAQQFADARGKRGAK